MRSLQLLINQARRASNNVEYSDNTGIGDEEFIQYANDAQDQLQSLVSAQFTDIFQVETEIDAVINQEEYDIPEDAFLGNRVDLVEYSPTGLSSDYYTLNKGSKIERLSGVSATPSFYIRRSGKLLLQPAPQQSGKIRVLYQKRLPNLDIVRGVVESVTLTSNAITALTLDVDQTFFQEELVEENYISVVDKYGTIKMRRIPISAVSETTGVVTIDAGFTFDTGETITAGDFVVRGYDNTTHPQLDDTAERYIIAYMAWKILKRDSSNDASSQETEMAAAIGDILAGFSQPDGGVNLIPLLDGQYLDSDY